MTVWLGVILNKRALFGRLALTNTADPFYIPLSPAVTNTADFMHLLILSVIGPHAYDITTGWDCVLLEGQSTDRM